MAIHRIAWNVGNGNIILNYNGEGNETVSVASDPNNLYDERQQVICVKLESDICVNSFIDTQIDINNTEFQAIIIDADDKILWGRYHDGTETDIDLTGYTISGVAVSDIINAIVDKTVLVKQSPKLPNFKSADGLFIITADNHYLNAKE